MDSPEAGRRPEEPVPTLVMRQQTAPHAKPAARLQLQGKPLRFRAEIYVYVRPIFSIKRQRGNFKLPPPVVQVWLWFGVYTTDEEIIPELQETDPVGSIGAVTLQASRSPDPRSQIRALFHQRRDEKVPKQLLDTGTR